ncbi:hypothetical protein ACFW04_014015 [Cataglyphis niger]
MNYYVPIENVKIPPCKKECDNISSEPRHAVHILGRKYALTPTFYKYLEIGISVWIMSCVLVLPFETWKSLMQKHADIERLLQTSQPPLQIRDLTIKVIKISDSDIIKITLNNNSLYMNPSTLIHLFDFEKCIKHMYYWLCKNTHIVNEKFKQFVKVLQCNNIHNAML